MQAIYLIKKLSSGFAAAVRRWHSEQLSDAVTQEPTLTHTLMRADIQILMEYATPNITPLANMNGDKEPAPTSYAARMPGGFRATPLPGLPTHLRYTTS